MGSKYSQQKVTSINSLGSLTHLKGIHLDNNDVKYLGQNLIREDISNGTEEIKIPCTNDIDHDSVPLFEYISKNGFSAPATALLESVLSNKEKLAKVCNGCDSF